MSITTSKEGRAMRACTFAPLNHNQTVWFHDHTNGGTL